MKNYRKIIIGNYDYFFYYRQKIPKYDKICYRISVKIGGNMDFENLSDEEIIEIYNKVTEFTKFLEQEKQKEEM